MVPIVLLIILFALGCWLLAAVSSCATRRQVVYADVADTLIVGKIDTVREVRYVTETKTEYRDRWNDRIVTLNVAGDTVKEVVRQNVYVEKDTHLRDSIDQYKARYDALMKSMKSQREKETTREPGFFERFEMLLYAIAVCLALVLGVQIVYNYRKDKKK